MTEPALSPDEPFRLQALRDSGQLDTPIEERFERVTRLAQRLLQTPIAAISLVDADRQWFKSIQGLNVSETSRAVSFCGHTILQEEVLVVSDARVDSRFCDNPLVTGSPNISFYAGCPIHTIDGSKVGSLCVIDTVPRTMSQEDLQILRDLAAVAESELSKSMQEGAHREMLAAVDAISRQAQVDGLTRVWNRTAAFELLDAEVARARRSRHGVGVIMVDLDHFKQINDSRGHGAGDEALRQAAKRMLGAIREVDALGRYGGEEFIVILGKCDNLAGAEVVGERIRRRIAESPFATDFGDFPLTVSVGVAFCDSVSDASIADALARAADQALYRAKEGGRNRVEAEVVVAGARADRPAA